VLAGVAWAAPANARIAVAAARAVTARAKTARA
jgi:hypothetical protein